MLPGRIYLLPELSRRLLAEITITILASWFASAFAEATALAEASSTFSAKLTALTSGSWAAAIDGKIELMALYPDLF